MSREDGEIKLRPRARLILAILIARGEGVPVSSDVLLDLIHGDEIPSSALPSLHNSVSELRRTLATGENDAPSISRTDLGYALTPGATQIDARLLDGNDERVDEIGPLLIGWSRPAYDGLHDTSLLADEAARLEIRRSALTERLAVDLLANGEPAEAADLLRPALRADPFATRLANLHAQSLRDMGRAGEADRLLASHEQFYVKELGVRPDAGRVATGSRSIRRSLPPPRRDRLFGRENEVSSLLDHLNDGSLVTLTGPAGIGKTRCAEAVGHSWPHSITFIDLSSAREPGDVLRIAAEQVGAGGVPEAARAATMREMLDDGQALLILDNAEHVAEGVRQLLEAVADVADLRILTTSQRRLGVGGELVVTLEPLAPQDAVDMLLNRAGSDPDLAADRAALADLVIRLDCLPLTVELAAGPLRTLGLDDLVASMHEFVATQPEDPAGLAASISRSLRLLPGSTAHALTACTAFEGPFTAAHAAELAGVDPAVFRRDLHELIERSLVQRNEGTTTYRMLGSIRDTLRTLLVDQLIETDVAERHTSLFRRLARRNERELVFGDGTVTLSEMAAEAADYRRALSRLTAAGDPDGIRMARQLTLFWFFSGRLTEGRESIQRSLDACHDRDIERARLLSAASTLAQFQGDFAAVERLLIEAAEIAGQANRTLFEMQAEAGIAFARGDIDRADELFERALELALESGKNPDMGADMAATCAWYRGRFEDVHQRFDLMGSLMRSKGVPSAQARWLRGRGLAAAMLGDAETGALDCYRSLELEREHGTDLGLGHASLHTGLVERVRGNAPAAKDHLESAIASSRRIGDTLTLVAALAGRIALGSDQAADHLLSADHLLAARLGEYDEIRLRWPVPVPPDLQPPVEDARRALLNRLGAAEFARLTRPHGARHESTGKEPRATKSGPAT